MAGRANVDAKRLGFRERFFTPVLAVFVVMTSSWLAYNLAWRLENDTLHRILASVSGTLLFLSVALGTPVVYSMAYFRGASLKERIAASLINPFLWATKECIRLSVSFSFFECVYYYANPLNIWLVFGVTAEMALAELFCRQRRRSQGSDIRVLHPGAVAVLLISLSLVVSLYLWGEGENLYAMFLEGYRVFFGPGTGVGVKL
ncbi:MAG: hypothetical protein ACWGSD_07955 [Thermodesulfobacteriota bacterium]